MAVPNAATAVAQAFWQGRGRPGGKRLPVGGKGCRLFPPFLPFSFPGGGRGPVAKVKVTTRSVHQPLFPDWTPASAGEEGRQ